jgi:site-specific recombinase XerD
MDNDENHEKTTLPTLISKGILTRKEFQQLADVPPELEWFANIDNARTRRAYQIDLKDFMRFAGILNPSDFRLVTRAHLIAWRKDLEQRQLGGATIRRKLAALSSLFEYLCERNAVESNPVKGVTRPSVDSYEGKTPALGDHQARALLHGPNPTRTLVANSQE